MCVRLRRQLPSNIFVQLLAGPPEIQGGVMGLMLWLVANVSLVVAPLSLLVLFQLKFLPYHSAVTWWQRAAVVADLALLWMLWPPVVRARSSPIGYRLSRWVEVGAPVLASLALVLLVTTIATYPGEWLDRSLPSVPVVPWKDGDGFSWRFATLHELLVAGPLDVGARTLRSPWSNRLVLPGLDVIDHTKYDTESKIASPPETISLRGRNLEGAVLTGATLRRADFTTAILSNASFDAADLRDAKFECAPGTKGDLDEECTQLIGASFVGARLQGASFIKAQLRNAQFVGAQLQGASLNNAQLQGAILLNARLAGAVLSGAHLQGASLVGTQLQGALLDYAELQGAVLEGAQLQHALLLGVFVWRADARLADADGARVVAPITGSKQSCGNRDDVTRVCDWSAASYQEIKQAIGNQDISRLDATNVLANEDEMVNAWVRFEKDFPALAAYEKGFVDQWRTTGCNAEGAPYTLRGMLRGIRYISAYSPDLPRQIAAAYLDKNCAGSNGLSEDDKATLSAIGNQPRASTP